MSTKKNLEEEKLRMESQANESYSPEVETSIWYN